MKNPSLNNIFHDFKEFKKNIISNFCIKKIPLKFHNPQDNSLLSKIETILLHSCKPTNKNNFSFLCFSPLLKITLKINIFSYENFTNKKIFKLKTSNINEQINFLKNFIFTLPFKKNNFQSSNLSIFQSLIFIGGWVGYFSYDWGAKNIEVKNQKSSNEFPDIYLLFYDKFIFYDLKKKKCFFISINKNNRNQKFIKQINTQNISSADKNIFKLIEILPQTTCKIFTKNIIKCKKYIKAGDIYQANISWKYKIKFKEVNPFILFKNIVKINPSPFCAFLNLKNFYIISNSPERLINKNKNLISTRPMAGTYPRGKNILEDKKLSAELSMHPKERAEHIMLVDLSRNDLGKVSDYSDVKVEELFNIEKYENVFHITSNVVGKVKKDINLLDIFLAIFPGGTITGCPKKRATEIIWELEQQPRNIYTGSIGYFSLNGNMDFNIAIRTLILKNKIGYLQIGAGIVYDSQPQKEYKETIYKANSFLKVFNLL